MSFESMQSIIEECKRSGRDFAQVVIDSEIKNTRSSYAEVTCRMSSMWDAMTSAIDNYDDTLRSRSNLSGGDGGLFAKYAAGGRTLCGSFASRVITYALKMAESNACMKRIVACPTAGSCGVLPSVLIPLYEDRTFTREEIIRSLFVAAGIGQVIANRASIAGAEGGCQAEVGSAAAMASGALVYLHHGSAEQIGAGTGYCLQNLMGLVCDPVAGLVEVPCVKRNVIGALDALSAADMALAGIIPKIPCDEVIDAMKKVGDSLSRELKETGQGGVADTPTARAFAHNLSAGDKTNLV